MPVVKITCPECEFNKEIDSASIPETATNITCPKCKHNFPLLDAETAKPKAVSKPEAADKLPDSFFLKPDKSKFKVLIAEICSKLTLKRTALSVGILLVFGCFVGRPFFVVLPELNGKIVHRSSILPPDASGKCLNEGDPIANAPVYLSVSIRKPILLKFGDGSSQPTVESTIHYYTYTDDKGNIRIPKTIAATFVFGTLLHRFYLDEVRVIVFNKASDGRFIDSNSDKNSIKIPKSVQTSRVIGTLLRPYNVYTSKDQKIFDALYAPGVKPLRWSDRLRHMKSKEKVSWWGHFKEWIWGKEWNLS